MLRNLLFKHEIASLILTTWTIICEQVLNFQSMLFCCRSLTALAALYLTLVSDLVGHCHFRILTQRVTFETWDPSDIWPEWCQKRQKEKKKKRRQKNKTKKQNKKRKDKKAKIQKTKRQKTKTKKRVYYFDVRAVSHSCDVFSDSSKQLCARSNSHI